MSSSLASPLLVSDNVESLQALEAKELGLNKDERVLTGYLWVLGPKYISKIGTRGW